MNDEQLKQFSLQLDLLESHVREQIDKMDYILHTIEIMRKGIDIVKQIPEDQREAPETDVPETTEDAKKAHLQRYDSVVDYLVKRHNFKKSGKVDRSWGKYIGDGQGWINAEVSKAGIWSMNINNKGNVKEFKYDTFPKHFVEIYENIQYISQHDNTDYSEGFEATG